MNIEASNHQRTRPSSATVVARRYSRGTLKLLGSTPSPPLRRAAVCGTHPMAEIQFESYELLA
jgi:hypothetical protein